MLSVCRSEKIGYEEIQKKHGDLWNSLEKVLDNNRNEGLDDWAGLEEKSLETRDALDTLFTIDFEIPSEMLPDAKPQQFGQAFGEYANTATSQQSRRAHSVSSAPGTTSSSASSKRKSNSSQKGSEKGKERKLKSSSTVSSTTTAAVSERKSSSSKTYSKPSRMASTSPMKSKPVKPDITSGSTPSTPPGSRKFTRSTTTTSNATSNKDTNSTESKSPGSPQEPSFLSSPHSPTTSDIPTITTTEVSPISSTPTHPIQDTSEITSSEGISASSTPSIAASIASAPAEISSSIPKPRMIGTVDEVEDEDSEMPLQSYEETDSSEGPQHEEFDDTGLETPKLLESPTESDDDDDLASGTEFVHGIPRKDSFGIDSDLTTTPRIEEDEDQ